MDVPLAKLVERVRGAAAGGSSSRVLKRELALRPDLALWLECSFATALERAVARAQEGLSPADTARAYETIYFPAQRLHLERDRPREAADAVVPNDPRLTAAAKR